MLQVAFLNLMRRKSRTILALIALMIGVAAIISLVSIVDGLQVQITDLFKQIQGVTVIEKGASGPIFSKIDVLYIQKMDSLPGVNVAVPLVFGIVSSIDDKKVDFAGPQGSSQIVGIDLDAYDRSKTKTYSTKVYSGEVIKSGDKSKVLIGKKIADDYSKFPGSSIKINGKKFIVKGIYSSNSSLIEGTLVMNIDDARDLLSFPVDKVSIISFDLSNPADDKKLVEIIKFNFKDKLTARTAADITNQIGGFLDNIRLMVFLIAGLSALVAGVGIINVMLMSVLERFKEIGALKAVGWTESDVLNMILIESILIGIIGGVFGLILGYFASNLADNLLNIPPSISIELLALTFLFAVSVGFIAGLYPAHYASKMDPIQALRTD